MYVRHILGHQWLPGVCFPGFMLSWPCASSGSVNKEVKKSAIKDLYRREALKLGGKWSSCALSGYQDFTERVHCAGSFDRALTLVSFTKGVSPPQRPALYTWLFKAWASHGACSASISSKRDTDFFFFVWFFEYVHTSSSSVHFLNAHRGVRNAWMRHLATSVSVVPQFTCPTVLPDAHQLVNTPPSSGNKDLKAREGSATSVIGALRHIKDIFSQKNWSRFDLRSVPKSSVKPTAHVWQGGSSEGQMWGEDWVQSSTLTVGVFFRGTRCVCVCVCRLEHTHCVALWP